MVGVLVALTYTALRAAQGSALENGQGVPYDGYLYSLGFSVVAALVTVALYHLFSRRIAPVDLTLAGLGWWLLLTVATTVYLPEGSYMFAWPLLFGLLALGWRLFAPQPNRAVVRSLGLLLLTFPAIPLVALTLYVLFALAALAGPGFVGIAYGVVSAILALCLGLLSPLVGKER